jgi:hypothetical protein
MKFAPPLACVEALNLNPQVQKADPSGLQGEPELQGGLGTLTEGLRSPVAVEGKAGED